MLRAQAAEWLAVAPAAEVISIGMATSLLFGTAALVLLVCASVCVFRRRVSRGRFSLGRDTPRGAATGGGAIATSSASQSSRRGLSQVSLSACP